MSQKISRKDLHTLYESVKNCATWKKKIEDTPIAQQVNDKIEVEDSVLTEAYTAGSDAQKKLLDKYFDIKSPKKIIDQISGLKDIFRLTGTTLASVVPYKKPVNKTQRSQNALALIQVITEAYNQGTVLDWNNTSQSKWYLWWQKNASGSWVLHGVDGVCYAAYLGFGCYFASKEAAQDAAKKFKDVFMDYLPE